MNKSTEELLNEIVQCEEQSRFFEENKNELCDLSLSVFLKQMVAKYNVKKAELFRKAGQEGSNYGYELFRNDKKVPSRDILIGICLAFPLSIEETQMALRCAGLATLYPRDRRDAYILFAIKNKIGIDELDEILEANKLATLL